MLDNTGIFIRTDMADEAKKIWETTLVYKIIKETGNLIVQTVQNGSLVSRTWIPYLIFLMINLILVLLGVGVSTVGCGNKNNSTPTQSSSSSSSAEVCTTEEDNKVHLVLLTGQSGAGKSTLIRLLVALINPRSGKIEIYNGKEQHESSTLTRSNFVYIPQGNSLVSGTVRDNLLMGNPDATEEQIKRALHIACADFILEAPDGIDSEITERGGGLSEGQAQRIAVARSILRPGSILILDEVTSALDEETEQEMLRRLTQSQIGKTLIFVTHRPAIIQYCSQVLRIEKPKKSAQ